MRMLFKQAFKHGAKAVGGINYTEIFTHGIFMKEFFANSLPHFGLVKFQRVAKSFGGFMATY